MTSSTNTDGTVTYCATLPAPALQVLLTDDGAYRVGTNTYIGGPQDAEGMYRSAAALIAVADRITADAAGRAEADRDLLASRLYADDTAKQSNPVKWADLEATAKKTYLDAAGRLIAMGVKVNG